MTNNRYLKSSVILKIVAFTLLGIVGSIDLYYSENTIYTDPFLIGAFTMAIASLATFINPKQYYIHTGMFFFIFAKIISQYTHSKHYTIWGHIKHS